LPCPDATGLVIPWQRKRALREVGATEVAGLERRLEEERKRRWVGGWVGGWVSSVYAWVLICPLLISSRLAPPPHTHAHTHTHTRSKSETQALEVRYKHMADDLQAAHAQLEFYKKAERVRALWVGGWVGGWLCLWFLWVSTCLLCLHLLSNPADPQHTSRPF
jgi:hypothetical protein